MSTQEDVMSTNDEASVPDSAEEVTKGELLECIRGLEARVEQLERENDELRSQLGGVSISWDEPAPDSLSFEHPDVPVTTQPIGVVNMLEENLLELDERVTDIEENGAEAGGQFGPERDRLRPAHRMWEDYRSGDKTALQKTQRRVGVLFGQFVERCVRDESTEVDASGQLYTLNSAQAQDALDEHGELDGVGEASRSTVVARVMRDVQRMTKEEDCDCEEIDDCSHGLVEFRPGKPHVLAVPKKQFFAVMQYAYDSSSATDTDDSSEQDDEDQVSSEMDQLAQAGREAGK